MSSYTRIWRRLPARQRLLLAGLFVAVVLANIRQPYPDLAPLQHVPTIIGLFAAPILLGRWPVSDRALGCIVGFLLLHTLAGRYIYSEVPYDRWSQSLLGVSIDHALGSTRNGFDRLVHFSFGMLAVPPVAQIATRHGRLSGRAALVTAFLFVGAVSAIYEIFEWLLTIVVAPDLAADYNGQQGDIWDPQKDMAAAIIGAVVSVGWQCWRGTYGDQVK